MFIKKINFVSVSHITIADLISDFVEKILGQISGNRTILDDLNQKEPQYNAVKNQAKKVITKTNKANELDIRGIRNKLDKLNLLWNDCHKMTKKLRRSLSFGKTILR
mgnify:CR=1 FL=1